MTALATRCQFVRAPGSLWRDTGLHVLVLPGKAAAEVVVLGGGGAVLWRVLGEPLTLDGIIAELGDAAASPPDSSAVAACLEDLVARGVVAWLVEEDEL